MKHVELAGLEIQTRRLELVVFGARAELVGRQVRPHPGLDIGTARGIHDELDLARVPARFA